MLQPLVDVLADTARENVWDVPSHNVDVNGNDKRYRQLKLYKLVLGLMTSKAYTALGVSCQLECTV